MKKVVRLTESDLARIVKRVLMEQTDPLTKMKTCLEGKGVKTDPTPQCAALLMKVVAELPNIDPKNPKLEKIPELMTDFTACAGSMMTFNPEVVQNVTAFIAALPGCVMENAGPQGGEKLTNP